MAKARLTGIDRLIYILGMCPSLSGAPCAPSRRRPRARTPSWPSLIHEASSSGVRLVLTNGRIGARNLRGYRRLFGVLGNPLKRFDRLLMRAALKRIERPSRPRRLRCASRGTRSTTTSRHPARAG